MAYQRNDENCDPVSPQPGKTTVNQFSGNEGWSQVTYKNFNADYQAQKVVQAIPAYDETRFKNVVQSS